MCGFSTYEGKTHTYMCIISYLLHVHVFSDEHANHMNFGSKFYDSLNIALCVYSCNLSITVTWSSRSLQICHDILVAIYCFVNHTLIIHMIFDCDAMLLAFVFLSMFLRNSKEMKNRIIHTYIYMWVDTRPRRHVVIDLDCRSCMCHITVGVACCCMLCLLACVRYGQLCLDLCLGLFEAHNKRHAWVRPESGLSWARVRGICKLVFKVASWPESGPCPAAPAVFASRCSEHGLGSHGHPAQAPAGARGGMAGCSRVHGPAAQLASHHPRHPWRCHRADGEGLRSFDARMCILHVSAWVRHLSL
jgi:hypothetical protein